MKKDFYKSNDEKILDMFGFAPDDVDQCYKKSIQKDGQEFHVQFKVRFGSERFFKEQFRKLRSHPLILEESLLADRDALFYRHIFIFNISKENQKLARILFNNSKQQKLCA